MICSIRGFRSRIQKSYNIFGIHSEFITPLPPFASHRSHRSQAFFVGEKSYGWTDHPKPSLGEGLPTTQHKVNREKIVDFVNLCRFYPRTVKGFGLSHMTIYVAYEAAPILTQPPMCFVLKFRNKILVIKTRFYFFSRAFLRKSSILSNGMTSRLSYKST